MKRLACATLVALGLAGPAMAEFQRISDRATFVSEIAGRELTRLGIRVGVTTGGDIKGSAFGSSVSGQWQWQEGYFCRSLFWGERNLGDNCQLVQVDGNTVRFTSDRGSGRSADLTIQ